MPRFTLRTLLVIVTLVAAVLGWLMWQRNIVQQRSEFLDMVTSKGGTYTAHFKTADERVLFVEVRQTGPPLYVGIRLPNRQYDTALALSPGPYRRWLSDRMIFKINMPGPLTVAAYKTAKALFPEAEIDGSWSP